MWNQQVAQGYDASSATMYAPEVLGPTVDFARRAGHGPALEFAIGTGRVALPFACPGVPVAGIELSEPMVAELHKKPGSGDIPVSIGDMASIKALGSSASSTRSTTPSPACSPKTSRWNVSACRQAP